MIKDNRHGHFYCFEGIDGAGKTTMAKIMSDMLSSHTETIFIDKKNIELFQNHAVKLQMRNIKKALWDYPRDLDLEVMGDYHWITLIASWYSTLEHACIRPLTNAGKNVVVDGWIYKYVARFSLKESVSPELIKALFYNIPAPDRVFLLNVEPSVAAQRKGMIKASEAGTFDGEEANSRVEGFVNYQAQVQQALYAIADENRWRVIDTAQSNTQQLAERLLKEFS